MEKDFIMGELLVLVPAVLGNILGAFNLLFASLKRHLLSCPYLLPSKLLLPLWIPLLEHLSGCIVIVYVYKSLPVAYDLR